MPAGEPPRQRSIKAARQQRNGNRAPVRSQPLTSKCRGSARDSAFRPMIGATCSGILTMFGACGTMGFRGKRAPAWLWSDRLPAESTPGGPVGSPLERTPMLKRA